MSRLQCGIVVLAILTIAVPTVATPPRAISDHCYLKYGTGKPVTAATSDTFSLYSSTPARNNPLSLISIKETCYAVVKH